MASENLYFLVEWELGEPYHHSYSVINSRIVELNNDIHTGKLVAVNFNGAVRRAKILEISDDCQLLRQNILKLEESNINSTLEMDSSMPSLNVAIEELKQKLHKRNSSGSIISSRQSPASQYTQDESIKNYNASLRPSTSHSPDIVPIKTKNKSSQTMDDSVANSISNSVRGDSILTEFSQLLDDLSKAQMQYLEISHYVDSLKEKVDLMSIRIKQWLQDTGLGFDVPINTANPMEDTVIVKPPKFPKMSYESRGFEENISNYDSEDDSDMVSIGTCKTKVPRYVLNQIDWRSHTIATRRLLMAVFPRKILATHSLTGKSSPAFANKPAKLCLDPNKVKDIVITVSEKCKVNPSLVRSAITTKCADENKMYRNREAKKRDNKKKEK